MPSSILDAFRFPFENPEAQQLHTIITQLNPTSQMAILAAEKAGLDSTMIFREQAPALLWAEILRTAAIQGLTRTLVQQTRDRLNPNNPQLNFFDRLLASQPVPLEDEPRTIEGAPNFLKDNDDIKEPEALLYYDDLMIQIGHVPALIATLQSLLMWAPSVCKFSVDFGFALKRGTGFRIGSDLLLTNWHVLHHNDETRATAVIAEFGFEDDGKGGTLASTAIQCDVASVVTSKDDDWAVIKSSQPMLDTWPIIKLSEAALPAANTPAYIIQHPSGDRKRLGFVRNQVSTFDDRVVHYLTDTREGSSGSPVFNAQGQLIALHHAGGRPQQILGRAPMKKNEGIRISRIVEGINKQNLAIP